ncbi:hypothetical protein DRQ09_04030, partial [candidate division KSB1 bacterium]
KYNIVFIGEYHRIKHDVELIQNLIPRLYRAGIYNLGIEFGCYEYQNKVDSLITADRYDEDLARWLMFKSFVAWGYKEYMDIYRKAWELNKSLPEDAPKFRVINLGYRANWRFRKENMTPELWRKVWHKGNPDVYMANVILKEFVDKGKKALIYSGSHHAFTHYYQPIYDYENRKFIRFNKNRMGNVVYHKIPDKVFNIFLHSPWPTKRSFNENTYPVDGVIDIIMKEFKNKRVGFDVKGSPFGKLSDDDTYYSIGYQNLTLSTFCDGYIFQKHFSDYTGCTVDTIFITEKNFKEAIEFLPNPEARKFIKKPADFIKGIQKDADMKKRFKHLK